MKAKNKLWDWCLRLEHHLCPDYCGYFASGLGNGVINMVGGALRQFIVLIPVIYVLTVYAGIDKAWYAYKNCD